MGVLVDGLHVRVRADDVGGCIRRRPPRRPRRPPRLPPTRTAPTRCRRARRTRRGPLSGVASMYLSEVAPPRLRAPVMALHQLFCTLGILAAQLLGTQAFFGTFDGSGDVRASLVACRALSSRSNSSQNSSQSPLRAQSPSTSPSQELLQQQLQQEALCSQLASGRWGGALVFPLVRLAFGAVLLLLGTESPVFVLRSRGDEEALRVL